MTTDPPAPQLGFLFDEHVNAAALEQLRQRGVDVVQVNDVGLAGADDAAIFEWSRRSSRIIVTRNYNDFAPLVEHAARQGLTFPGVLFYSAAIHQADVGSHVRALESWISEARSAGRNSAQNTLEWLIGSQE